MTKEAIAIIGLGLTLIASAVGYGMQIGALTERVEAQRQAISGLTAKIDSMTLDLNGTRLEIMRLFAGHTEPPQPRRPR